MAKDNLIHIKLEYEESLNAKRDILSSEVALLRIATQMNGYKHYRTKELDLKIVLSKKLKELKTNISSLHKVLPTLKLPELLKKEDYGGQKKLTSHTTSHVSTKDIGIEAQLREIERKLNELQSRRA
ncbi:hypothetical protein COU59_02650 [Candidatus Pacearchaeota archaeon CG10_big_fil_rev_8_21_14_0_10_34_12]|nr:MAG: hypothetical protein COU59_02650 [Candidatus Pacearchaeota archaeon CG10_big_fil_rev_8_21_14_0_10_34_12]